MSIFLYHDVATFVTADDALFLLVFFSFHDNNLHPNYLTRSSSQYIMNCIQ
jgi:hypothetical protein